VFYVSGYALKTINDENGSCYFLNGGKCRIYENRPLICRVYPYMLHREADEDGKVDWRQISGLNLHGDYNLLIKEDECIRIAEETIRYEEEFLLLEINFLKSIKEFFAINQLKHVQKVFDQQLRLSKTGESVKVRVYYKGKFEDCI